MVTFCQPQTHSGQRKKYLEPVIFPEVRNPRATRVGGVAHPLYCRPVPRLLLHSQDGPLEVWHGEGRRKKPRRRRIAPPTRGVAVAPPEQLRPLRRDLGHDVVADVPHRTLPLQGDSEHLPPPPVVPAHDHPRHREGPLVPARVGRDRAAQAEMKGPEGERFLPLGLPVRREGEGPPRVRKRAVTAPRGRARGVARNVQVTHEGGGVPQVDEEGTEFRRDRRSIGLFGDAAEPHRKGLGVQL
mmetsp:Transcript_47782/g.144504  ORF Transcript_47782/g.144504 Transcript_47782/m.144504 type:complete len:242 (+) Transcript_47782:1424-2149(+)